MILTYIKGSFFGIKRTQKAILFRLDSFLDNLHATSYSNAATAWQKNKVISPNPFIYNRQVRQQVLM